MSSQGNVRVPTIRCTSWSTAVRLYQSQVLLPSIYVSKKSNNKIYTWWWWKQNIRYPRFQWKYSPKSQFHFKSCKSFFWHPDMNAVSCLSWKVLIPFIQFSDLLLIRPDLFFFSLPAVRWKVKALWVTTFQTWERFYSQSTSFGALNRSFISWKNAPPRG